MDFDEAAVVRTYASEALASIGESRLRFEGIEAHIKKDDCGGAYPSLHICAGVRLLVKAEDLKDAEEILNKMDAEQVQRELESENQEETNSRGFEVLATNDLPSEQLDQLKTIIFTYILIVPLLSALFADKIDNIFIVCLLFVGLVGTAFIHLRNRMRELEQSLKEQERRLMELERVNNKKSE
jgi:hypothetical protein